jgi:hypothetical protein
MGAVRIGDKVRLIGVPPDIHDDEELQTRRVFEKCLGQIFAVAGLEAVDGIPDHLVRLDVGHIFGQAPHLQTIWVEPEYLELVAR